MTDDLAQDASDPTGRAAYSAPALEKGLDILELLAESAEPLTARQIAERLGRSKAEIFRMVYVLVDRGYLARDPTTDQLSLTNRLFALGMRTPRTRALLEVALPLMQRLSDEIGQSSHLVVLNRGHTVVIAAAKARTDFSFQLELGYSRPAISAASGLMMLALQSPTRRARLIAECTEAAGAAPDKAFNAELDAIAARGFVMSESHHIVGVVDICAPICDPTGHAMASLVVPCLLHIETDRNLDAMRERALVCCSDIVVALYGGP